MNDYDTPADLAKAMRDQLGRPPSELAQHLTSTARLNVIELWPELFVEVSDVDAQAIQDACVASWHEGWEPQPCRRRGHGRQGPRRDRPR